MAGGYAPFSKNKKYCLTPNKLCAGNFMENVLYRVRDYHNGPTFELTGTAYELGEEGCPDYVSLEDISEVVYDLKVGDHVETRDGYVVPVIKVTPKGIRFLNSETLSYYYHKYHIWKKNMFPTYHQVIGKKGVLGKLTERHATFVFALARTLDLGYAGRVAGYKSYHNMLKLLEKESIQRGLRMSLEAQIKASGKEEKDLFLSPYMKLIETLQGGVVDNLVDNPDAAAKMADILSKNLMKMGELLESKSNGMDGFSGYSLSVTGKVGNDMPMLPKSKDLYLEEGKSDESGEEVDYRKASGE